VKCSAGQQSWLCHTCGDWWHSTPGMPAFYCAIIWRFYVRGMMGQGTRSSVLLPTLSCRALHCHFHHEACALPIFDGRYFCEQDGSKSYGWLVVLDNWMIFTTRRYASAVLGVVIPSVCPSVCHTRALWLIQRTYRRYFYTRWKGRPSFLLPNSGWWATSASTFNGPSKLPTPFKIAHVDRFPPVTLQQ